MADQPTEKPEVEAPVADAQEISATETKPTEPSSTEENAAKADAETIKEDNEVTKAAEVSNHSRGTGARSFACQTYADHVARLESKEAESSEKPAEAQNADERTKEEEKPVSEGDDIEMKDATEAPAAEKAIAESSAPPADGETASASAAFETPASKAKNNRRKSTADSKAKTLNKKGSKARLTHLGAKPGDHFLVKLKGFPAWPAIICDESMLPHALVSSRPVTAARPDGTYTEAYADGGKRVNDRSFPLMYLYTNEFGWVPNMSLTELSPEKAQDTITEKMRKDLREAFMLAAQDKSLEYYKNILKQFQEELIEHEEAKKAAATKKSKKGKAKAPVDDDLEMDDVDDAPQEKSKTKKRKADDDVSTPQRPDSVKKPKIKINVGSAARKSANSTPKGNDEAATPAKLKLKKTSEKKVEAPKEQKLTPEQRKLRKEKEVLYLRHKLQRGLLTRDQQPQESEMKQMSEYVTMLENFKDLEVSIIRVTKINKVLKAILKLESIPREDEFHFKDRSQTLLDKWTKLMATDAPASTATNGVNGKSEAQTDEKKEDSDGGKEDSEEPKKDDSEKPKEEAEPTPEVSAAEEKSDKEEAIAPPEPVEAVA
ncbi:hypothetical protein FZEAL_5508 [Fusarium zealandicum]|uniref:PWWP domain-containing protein n=1 Tax=Fusarium zealandicum TaxID=1053134 RepID=A0A8H4UJK8_9HYPO|nr:hypothetical protein FZEAL_5508 [Fusarium zealandicum]